MTVYMGAPLDLSALASSNGSGVARQAQWRHGPTGVPGKFMRVSGRPI